MRALLGLSTDDPAERHAHAYAAAVTLMTISEALTFLATLHRDEMTPERLPLMGAREANEALLRASGLFEWSARNGAPIMGEGGEAIAGPGAGPEGLHISAPGVRWSRSRTRRAHRMFPAPSPVRGGCGRRRWRRPSRNMRALPVIAAGEPLAGARSPRSSPSPEQDLPHRAWQHLPVKEPDHDQVGEHDQRPRQVVADHVAPPPRVAGGGEPHRRGLRSDPPFGLGAAGGERG